ncbi:MAG: phosphotransferase [Streptosporangiales bacterium]|nr:phosphotransferase [Streptosporangiales bacterium]
MGTSPGAGAEEGGRIEAVLSILREAGELDGPGEEPRLTQLEGGWSRHTYVLSRGEPREGRAYVVRVKPPGGLLDSDLVTEYKTYRALQDSKVPIPPVYGCSGSADNPFGGPFFVMGWKPGEAPNVWRRRDRERLEADWYDGRVLAGELARILADIHEVDPDGLTFLGPPRSFDDVVGRWRETYEEMRLVDDPIVEEAFAWVASRRPPPVPPTLVHGDYRIGNMLLHRDQVSAVMDWELAYVGDPHFDLGYTSLRYVAGRFAGGGSLLLDAVADREWFYARYERLSGRAVDREAVDTYAALGALMLITILCTGVRMYEEGRTSDIRMAWNRFAIPGLRQELTSLMGW